MAGASLSGHGVAMNIIDFNQVLACWSLAMFKLQPFLSEDASLVEEG